jgi:hypothetical protein
VNCVVGDGAQRAEAIVCIIAPALAADKHGGGDATS